MKTLAKTLAAATLLIGLGLVSCETENILPENSGGNNTETPEGGNSGNNGDDKSGGLHADIPLISGLTYKYEFTCNGGIKKVYSNASTDWYNTIENYKNALREAGFTNIGSTQGGGWGTFGGRQAWAYKGSKYVKINAQVQGDTGSVVYVCAWPNGRPQDDDCDRD